MAEEKTVSRPTFLGAATFAIGRASKVGRGVPAVKIQRKAGWILNEDGREFIAMFNICTHLGWRGAWEAVSRRSHARLVGGQMYHKPNDILL